MPEYIINIIWDDEAQVWVATNDDIPIALESGSLDALVVLVKFAVPELLELNGLMPESESVTVTAKTVLYGIRQASGFANDWNRAVFHGYNLRKAARFIF